MTSTEKLQPYFESYSQKIKQRRNELGMSSKALAAKSGVPYSNICRVDTGAQANPLLYNAAATADVLGLSLDELCGLTVPENNADELKSRCRKLELENARLAATRAAQQEHIKAVHSLCCSRSLLSPICSSIRRSPTPGSFAAVNFPSLHGFLFP